MGSPVSPEQIAGWAYQSHPPHRNGARDKSQWIITEPDEHGVFEKAIQEHWHEDDRAWGLQLSGNARAVFLGKSPADEGQVKDLFIARFELATVCHGYPVDYQRSEGEKPPTSVLGAWLQANALRPAVIRKILRGQRCRL
jgi:hypothetical protein